MVSIALLLTFAQSTKIDLKVRAQVGTPYIYRMRTAISDVDSTGRAEMSTRLQEKLLKTQGDSLFWEVCFSDVNSTASGNLEGAGETFKAMNGFRMVSVQDRRGQVTEIRYNELAIKSSRSANVVLPPEPVAVGDHWDAEIESANQVWKIQYRLAEVVDGSAKIVGEFAAGQAIEMVKPTVFWVDVKSGKMTKANSESIITMGTQKIRLEYEIELVGGKKS